MKKPLVFRKKRFITVATALVLTVCIAACYLNVNGKREFAFETVTVQKGAVSNVVTATGTLEATNTVVVGTQVSGVIKEIFVDFNSPVKKGQLLATLDKSTLQFTLENAEAEVSNAQAEHRYQKANYERMKTVYDKGMLSASDYDLARYNYEKSEAALKSATSNLKKSSQNLSYATIYSPIDGIILNRAVEEGQTVAASMSTPELFTITNDLSTMQVEANVDEADIGLLQTGQRVEFTVDAFSGKTFNGTIAEIRLQPNESSNVVTYVVIITVSNPDLKLKPGLTANITIYTEEAADVLLVAEKATQFTPDRQLWDDYMRQVFSERRKTATANTGNAKDERIPGTPPAETMKLNDSQKIVWVKNNEQVHPVTITTGIDDGTNIEVLSGLEEGTEVVTSFTASGSSGRKATSRKKDDQISPFVQSGPKGPPGGGGGPDGPPR